MTSCTYARKDYDDARDAEAWAQLNYDDIDTSVETYNRRMNSLTLRRADENMTIGNFSLARKWLDMEMSRLYDLKTEGKDVVQCYMDRINACYRRLNACDRGSLTVSCAPPRTLVPIRVTYDAGFGNTIELRGTRSAQLSWEKGKDLICKDATHWALDLDVQTSFECKLVLRQADGKVIWEELEYKKNRSYPSHGVPYVDLIKGIVPVFRLA